MRLKVGRDKAFSGLGGLLLGLILAQVLATIHVYLSNAHLHEMVTVISEAGYLAVPNQHAALHLKDPGPAIWGGFFFTVSLGAGLSVLSFTLARLWDQILGRNKIWLILFLLCWLGFLVTLNWRGISPMVSLYFLLIPTAVFWLSVRRSARQLDQNYRRNRIVFLLPVAALVVLWSFQLDDYLFINIRDSLLLSNPVGKRINDVYYRYTLYPAEVFKSLDQKLLKTVNLTAIQENPLRRRMENVLLRYDYLPLGKEATVDLTVKKNDGSLAFMTRNRTILQITSREFFARPAEVLRQISAKSDCYLLFRQATFWSLLIGFPILLYLFIFSILRGLTGLFIGSDPSVFLAAVLCFFIGLALLFPVMKNKGMAREVKDVSEALEAKHWEKRVAALKIIKENRLEINDFPAYRQMLSSPKTVERYWLGQALGVSRRAETYQDLLSLWDDPSLNVVCMVYEALGWRGERRVTRQIIERINKSDDWYVQGYAYRALRKLGWKQRRSS